MWMNLYARVIEQPLTLGRNSGDKRLVNGKNARNLNRRTVMNHGRKTRTDSDADNSLCKREDETSRCQVSDCAISLILNVVAVRGS